MAQHDYVIDNQSSSGARTDLNNLFQAIMSMNSGATAPSTTVANMIWYDTANDLLKMRNEANTGFITLGTVNQSTNNFESATVNGKTVGTLTAAGGIAYATSTSALAAIGAGTSGQVLQSNGASAPSWASSQSIGVGQTWQNFTSSRTVGTWYQNTTGRPISVYIQFNTPGGIMYVNTTASLTGAIQVGGQDGASGTWDNSYAVVPNGIYYSGQGSSTKTWSELR